MCEKFQLILHNSFLVGALLHMERDKQHFDYCSTQNQLTDVFGKGILAVRQCQNWFANFRSGNFNRRGLVGSMLAY